MTEQTTSEARPSEAREPEVENRCAFGSKSDNPCWREAVVPRWDEDLINTSEARMVCEEHRLALDRGRAAEELGMDLDALQAVIRGHLDDIEASYEGGYRVRDLLYHHRGELEQRYLEALVKSKAAWRVADRVPTEADETFDLEEELDLQTLERVEALLVRSEGLVNALAVLEDLGGEAYGHADRWQIAAVVSAASREGASLDAEAEKLRAGLERAKRSSREKRTA